MPPAMLVLNRDDRAAPPAIDGDSADIAVVGIGSAVFSFGVVLEGFQGAPATIQAAQAWLPPLLDIAAGATQRASALTGTAARCAPRSVACINTSCIVPELSPVPFCAQLSASLSALPSPLPLRFIGSEIFLSVSCTRSMPAAARLGREGLGSPGGALPSRPHRQPFTSRRAWFSCKSDAANGKLGNGACSGGLPPAAGEGAALQLPRSACEVPCGKAVDNRNAAQWPHKSDIYILRSDGHSCTRETVLRE